MGDLRSSRLELVESAFPSARDVAGPGTFREGRHFLDIHVDGHSLRDQIPEAGDMVTPLCKEWVDAEVRRSIDRWLGRSTSGDRRLGENEVEILVCAACGDLDCGAVTARIDVSPTTVTWSRFTWVGAGEPEPDDVIDILGPGFVFGRDDYEATLTTAANRVGALPGERPQPPAARPRSWWQRLTGASPRRL